PTTKRARSSCCAPTRTSHPDRRSGRRRGRREPRATLRASMDVSLFDYDFLPDLIAQEPVEPRDAARLLVLDCADGGGDGRRFSDLPSLLEPGDCLVANRSRVIPARLLGTREDDGRPVELLMLRPLATARWEALVRPGRRCRIGARLAVAAGAAHATVVGQG